MFYPTILRFYPEKVGPHRRLPLCTIAHSEDRMADIARVKLTAALRKVHTRIGLRLLDDNGASLLAGSSEPPFEEGERATLENPVVELERAGTCHLLRDVARACASTDPALLTQVLTGNDATRLGEVLTEELFGLGEEHRALFMRLYQLPLADRPTCLARPSRLQIRAAPGAEDLLLLPWRAMAFQGEPLRGHDWTFALSTGQGPCESPMVLRPCPVVLLVPERGPAGAAAHAEALLRRLCAIEPAFGEEGRVRRVMRASDLEDAIRIAPTILYWNGEARVRADGELQLQFDDDDAFDLAHLVAMLDRLPNRPAFAYLGGNLTGERVALAAARQLEPRVPAFIVHPAHGDINLNRRVAEEVFIHLFRDGLDPAAALERATADVGAGGWQTLAATLWGRYDSWRTNIDSIASPTDAERVFLQLDRYDQRAKALHLLQDMIEGRLAGTRALSLIYVGTSGNHIDRFAGELFGDLSSKLRGKAALIPIEGLAFPHATDNYRGALRGSLAAALGAAPGAIGDMLARRARLARGLTPVFWLDWGSYPRPGAPPIKREDAVRWQLALHDELLEHLPAGMTAVSLLGREVRDPQKAVVMLEQALEERRLLSGPMLVEVLSPLGDVHLRDLVRLFRENASRLRIHQDDWHPVAERIWRLTGGAYAKTLRLLVEAMAKGWRTFLDETRGAATNGSESDDDD